MDRKRVPVFVDGQLKWSDEKGNILSSNSQQNRTVKMSELSFIDKVRVNWNSVVFSLVVIFKPLFQYLSSNPLLVIGIVCYLIIGFVLPSNIVGLLTIVLLIIALFKCTNSRPMRANELSAYSIYNPGGQKLAGEFDADRLNRELRGGGVIQSDFDSNVDRTGSSLSNGRFSGRGNVLGSKS